MMNCNTRAVCIYITDGYPFDKGDVFSFDDVKFLQKEDWDLIVLPRTLPNISLHHISELPVETCLKISKNDKICALLSIWTLPIFLREMCTCILHKTPFYPRRALNAIALALHARLMLRKLIKTKGWEKRSIIIYSFWFTPELLGIYLLKREFPHIRIITRLHGADLYAHRARNNYAPLRYWRSQFADIFAPCSRQGVTYLEGEGIPTTKLYCSYLGVPTLPSAAHPSKKGELHLVSCSFAVPIKRLPLLGKSLLAFAQKHVTQRVTWHHIGDGPALTELQQLMQGAPENLIFHGHGQLSQNDARQFFLQDSLEGLDGLINVSASEGLPVSMMEAQMAGLPVIGTDVGGVAEIIRPDTGILLPKEFTQDQFDSALFHLSQWKTVENRLAIAQITKEKFSLTNYKLFIDNVIMKQINISKKILENK